MAPFIWLVAFGELVILALLLLGALTWHWWLFLVPIAVLIAGTGMGVFALVASGLLEED